MVAEEIKLVLGEGRAVEGGGQAGRQEGSPFFGGGLVGCFWHLIAHRA